MLGPLIAAALLGALILAAQWAFGKGNSLIESSREYGLLEPVAEGVTTEDLSAIDDVLFEAGIRSTIAKYPGGYRLLVWPADLTRTRDLLRQVRGLN